MDLSKTTILGRLGRDPETRVTQSGKSIVNLSVATSERWSDRATGEQKERTEWHRVVIFNEHLANFAQNLTKGERVYIEGQNQTRKWTGHDGQERYTTEVVLQGFDAKLIGLGGGHGGEPAQRQQSAAPLDDLDDDIPF